MQLPERKGIVAIFLRRFGGLLATVSALLGIASSLVDQGSMPGEPSATMARETQSNSGFERVLSVSRTAPESLNLSEVQVAVAEAHEMSPEDWSLFLAALAGDLRLGLSVEVCLPTTRSKTPPPSDPLNRLLWAKGELRAGQIELKIEQGTIRVLPIPPGALPLEAMHRVRQGSHPWEPAKTLELQASPATVCELSFNAPGILAI